MGLEWRGSDADELMRTLMLACAFLLSASAMADEDDLKCETGPVTKTFGGTSWLVYSCNEERHLMLNPAPGSPAGATIFMVFWDDGHWTVMDLGTGSKRAADAARQDLRSLSEQDIMNLIAETKAH